MGMKLATFCSNWQMTKLTPYRQQSCPTSLGATSTKGIGFLMKKPNYFAISFYFCKIFYLFRLLQFLG